VRDKKQHTKKVDRKTMGVLRQETLFLFSANRGNRYEKD